MSHVRILIRTGLVANPDSGIWLNADPDPPPDQEFSICLEEIFVHFFFLVFQTVQIEFQFLLSITFFKMHGYKRYFEKSGQCKEAVL